MKYEIDQSYHFDIVPGNQSDPYFLIKVDTPHGPDTVQLSKLDFQKSPGYPVPSMLYCRVKRIGENGLPVLTHVVPPYIYDLYRRTFETGDTFECEVVSVPAESSEEPFMLRDRYGIYFRYNEPEGLLSKGQVIRCKFAKLTPQFFQIARVDEGAKLPFYSPSASFEALHTDGAVRRAALAILHKSLELTTLRAELAAKNPLWFVNGARTILALLPEWFLKAKLQRRHRICSALVTFLRDGLLYLLEGSGFLNAVSPEHRRALRQQLTEMVDSIEPFTATLNLIAENRQDSFVEQLLDKLRKSGYLYHPAHQFATLMLIFRLHPDKVGNYLNRIFESIFGRDLDNWKREPFRSAFVEQFEIYISQARRDIDALPKAESREQKSRLETIITAIALQLLLADEKADLRKSESLFYRYISLLRPLNTEALLTKSFVSMLGVDVNTNLSYLHLKEPMMMMTRATVMPADDLLARLDATHRFSNGAVEFSVSQSGLQLSLCRRRDISERVIPEGLMPWLRPQILLKGVRNLAGVKVRRLPDHREWWQEIETSLFEAKTETVRTPEPKTPPRRADLGDEVFIVIDRIEDYYSPNPTFVCRIQDSEYAEGTGILKRDQIVAYNLKQPDERAFRNSMGQPLGFLATVTDVRTDGTYVFSLRHEIDRYIDETFNFETEYEAVVAGINDRDYSGITGNGVGLFLDGESARGLGLKVGDIVRCRMSNIGKQGQLKAYVLGVCDNPQDHFNKHDAFCHLMHSIGVAEPQSEEDDEDGETMCDVDEMLSPAEMREIIGIIRLKAIAETDLIKAYDYLRFARLLAILIGDTTLADKLSAHAALLTLHQYYATNSRIESDKLEALRSEADADPLLHMIFHRLELVSWLGHPERIAELYQSATSPSTELEGSIARLVLSYNMLKASENDDTSSIASEIQQQIKKKLNLNNETRRAKYYGSESKYLEFKTSIVYPATAPGHEMRENPQEQQFHILSRIAGLLNANGGRLYIGVNNDGYEVGLHDDFKYYERKSTTVGRYTFRIRNIDNMCVYLENLINETFGESVGRKIEVSADDEARKGVILIDVAESPDPVFLDGRLFVRQSGQSTREYHGAAVEEFVREREELKAERSLNLSMTREQQKDEEVPAAENTPAAGVRSLSTESVPVEQESEEAEVTTSVATSRWRPNVLHHYEAGYVEPGAYIYILADGHMRFSRSDMYLEPGENCELALAVPHELEDGYLILGFENERILKVPMQEIFAKGEKNIFDYNNDYRLMFAALAGKDDALACIAADNSGNMWKRCVRLSSVDQSHLTSTPRRLHDAPVHHTIGYDIVDASVADNFKDCMPEALSNRRFGLTMRVKENSSEAKTRLEQLILTFKAPTF